MTGEDCFTLKMYLKEIATPDRVLDQVLSTGHLSCLETGRAQPSQEMILRLAEALRVPLHERNALLLAAGYGR